MDESKHKGSGFNNSKASYKASNDLADMLKNADGSHGDSWAQSQMASSKKLDKDQLPPKAPSSIHNSMMSKNNTSEARNNLSGR